MKVQPQGFEPWTSGLSSQHYTNKLKRLGQYIGIFIVQAQNILNKVKTVFHDKGLNLPQSTGVEIRH